MSRCNCITRDLEEHVEPASELSHLKAEETGVLVYQILFSVFSIMV